MRERLVELLTESRRRGFLGPGPAQHHLDHATTFAAAVPNPPARSLDLGAGGGLPGLVLAATAWPDTQWTFLDAQAKRTEFLVEAVAELGLQDRVAVRTARAEEFARLETERGRYDLVVARSFAAPPVVAECAAPLLQPGGLLVVSEPPAADLAARWPPDGLARVGLGRPEPLTCATDAGDVHLVRLRCEAVSPESYPRRTGVPAKRPLWKT